MPVLWLHPYNSDPTSSRLKSPYLLADYYVEVAPYDFANNPPGFNFVEGSKSCHIVYIR